MIVPAVGNPGHFLSTRGQGTRELLLPLDQCLRSDRIHMTDLGPGIGDDGASGHIAGCAHQQRRRHGHNVVAHKLIVHRTFEAPDMTDHIVAQHHIADKIPDDGLEKNVTDRTIEEPAHIY